jgi:hypothetical protein
VYQRNRIYYTDVTQNANADTRTEPLDAAEQVTTTPGEDISLRVICAQAGVKIPTLHPFFGRNQGFLDAAVKRGFDL